MNRTAFFSAVLMLGVAAAFVWERGALAQLRQQNQSLLAMKQEADRLASDNNELDTRREQAGIAAPGSGEHTELLRLRNEIRQLRAQKREAEKLREENQRLAAEIKSGNVTPPKLSDMEGYVAKETWANIGFTTPEATLQTLLWAMSTANLEQLLQCVIPEAARHFQQQLERQPDQFRKDFFGEGNLLSKVTGFRIAERTTLAEDKIRLGIQVVANGAILPLEIWRVGNDWKVDMR